MLRAQPRNLPIWSSARKCSSKSAAMARYRSSQPVEEARLLAGLGQLLGAELAQRVEHPVPVAPPGPEPRPSRRRRASTTDLSTRPISASTTSSGLKRRRPRRLPRPPPGRTSRRRPTAAATAPARPACTARRIHSIAVRSVWCRGGAAAAGDGQHAESGGRAGRPARPAAAPRSRTAASSMASGMPSSRRQTRSTSARFAAVTVNPGAAAAARCANSSTASDVP